MILRNSLQSNATHYCIYIVSLLSCFPNCFYEEAGFLFFLLLNFKGNSQTTEEWDVYKAQYENGPGSVLIDMGLKKIAPDTKLAFLLITGVTYNDYTVDGFPTKAEFQNLYRISDSASQVINGLTYNKITGTFTCQRQRMDYYYVSDTNHLREKLSDIYQKRFPGYQPLIIIREDKKWDKYLNFLYPNDETLEYMNNSKIVLRLEEAGDKLEKERQVDHWIYFGTDKDRQGFIEYALKNKYKIEDSDKVNQGSFSFQLHISRTDKVDLPNINKITLALRKEAEKHKGDYDGWETFVIK